MKAALLSDYGKLELIDAEAPTIGGPDQVLIQVKVTGICGSEVHAFKGTHPFRKPPSILGHEMSGQVVAVGDEVTQFSVGDRVFMDPQWTCGRCQWCLAGDQQLCPEKVVLGTTTWTGSFGEFLVAPEAAVYHLPDNLTDTEGTLIEPLSVAVHAVRRAKLQADESVAILGTGPIGMVTAAMARVKQATPIITVDMQPHCLDIAAKLGATHGLLTQSGDPAAEIMQLTDGLGVDVVFLTVGVQPVVETAMRIVARQGRIVLIALFDEPLHFEAFNLISGDRDMIGSNMYNAADIRAARELMATGQIDLKPMVSHTLPLADVQRGFELAASKQDQAVKVVLNF